MGITFYSGRKEGMKDIPSLLYWCSRRAKDGAFSLFTQANKWMREKEIM
jgi:hypothetical protein